MTYKQGCVLLLFLCACPGPVIDTPKEPVVISGMVELLEAPSSLTPTRFTLAGVKVVLEGEFTNVTETDETGSYAFAGVPPGRYTLRASFGEFTREGEVTTAIEPVSGENLSAPTLTLTPAGGLKGRATLGGKQSGNLGIRVSIDGTDLVTTTDDAGRFSLARVPVGSYRVRVEKSDFGGRTLRGVEVKFSETVDMGTLDITQGVFSDFNNPPAFSFPAIQVTRYQVTPGSSLTPLPLDIGGTEVARFDTLRLDAPATDLDGDRLTYFWSVTAGTLDRTDVDSVLWTVDDDAALSATITVRVVDERSASAYQSADLQIIDAQAMSGRFVGTHAVYSYRRFSGKWRVLDFDFATGTLTAVGELSSLDDPRVAKVGDFYVASPFVDGDRALFFWQQGQTPAARTVDGSGRGLPLGNKYARTKNVGGKTRIIAYDPATNASADLFDCGSATCGELMTTRDDFVVTLARSADQLTSTIVGYNAATAEKQSFVSANGVGDLVRTDGVSIVHSDAPPGFGRSSRNSIVRSRFPTGGGGDVYLGLYDVFVGGFDGRYVGFTEQEYRVVYAPEVAYLYDTDTNTKSRIDPHEGFAYDQVCDLAGGRVMVRRYSRNDWLRDDQRTHFELTYKAL
jgi:hypothetical protein